LKQGNQFPVEIIEALRQRAALKEVTDLGDCADMYISIAKNTSMTGQRITVGKYSCFLFPSRHYLVSKC